MSSRLIIPALATLLWVVTVASPAVAQGGYAGSVSNSATNTTLTDPDYGRSVKAGGTWSITTFGVRRRPSQALRSGCTNSRMRLSGTRLGTSKRRPSRETTGRRRDSRNLMLAHTKS